MNIQPYKYNGKEWQSRIGLYDYHARQQDPMLTRFLTIDPLAEKYPWISPYAYALNNPVNAIDPDGKVVIFINGMHAGDGGKSGYWNGFDTKVMNHLNDYTAEYFDGSFGGHTNLPRNHSASYRQDKGFRRGLGYAGAFQLRYQNKDGSFDENIKVITHSMGAAFAKGFIQGLLEAGIPLDLIEFEADFAPFQPTKQEAIEGVKTYQFSNANDDVANNQSLGSPYSPMKGAEVIKDDNPNKGHSITDFMDKIKYLPAGNYNVVNGQIVPQ